MTCNSSSAPGARWSSCRVPRPTSRSRPPKTWLGRRSCLTGPDGRRYCQPAEQFKKGRDGAMRSILGATAFILATAASALAQERPLSTTKEMDQTVRVTVTGEVDLDYVWRRQEITAFKGGVSGAGAPGNSDSENTFEGFVALRLNVELSDKVSAIIEVGTKRVDGGQINFFAGGNGAG